jgi:hypothetical protein
MISVYGMFSLSWFGWFSVLACGEDADTATHTATPTEVDTDTDPPASFEVTGQVLDGNGTPIAEANVLIGGQPDTLVLTDENGMFSLWYTNIYKGTPAVVASKLGYRAQGFEFFKPETPISFKLREIKAPDNTEYTFQNPGSGEDQREENCSHCHTDFVKDFWTSKHSESASNTLLHDLYAGVTRLATTEQDCTALGGSWKTGIEPGTEDSTIEKCYVEHGVLSDLNPSCKESSNACDDPTIPSEEAPSEFGGCADCHAPGIDGELMGRDLHDAVGLAYDAGIHCDTCHKVKDVDMTKPAGFGSRLVVHRPGEPGRNTFEWDPVYYGPIKDVPNVAMAASPQEKFNEAVFCAGCHEHNQDALLPETSLDTSKWPEGLPIQSTYSEWEDGPYNNEATPCQWCHMPSYVDKSNAVDIATVENQSITFGFPRPTEDVRQHIFRSPLEGTPRLIDTAVHLSIIAQSEGNTLTVSTSVANVGCGHAIPTGEPLRAMYVVLELNEQCRDGTVVEGPILDDVAGFISKGIVGEDITMTGQEISWYTPLDISTDTMIQVLRPTGEYEEYVGIGRFADASLSPAEKGLAKYTSVAKSLITEVNDNTLTLDTSLSLESGDIVYIVENNIALQDDQPSKGLAGMAGQSFAKILVDSQGAQQVPHYRATDILRDNRIPPGSNVVLNHVFELPDGCSTGSISAKMIYRPIPMIVAAEYNWASNDFIIATTESNW